MYLRFGAISIVFSYGLNKISTKKNNVTLSGVSEKHGYQFYFSTELTLKGFIELVYFYVILTTIYYEFF